MATTSTSTAVATVEPVFTEPERLALAGFLAGYTGLTREAYALDLRQYANWCQQRHLRLFQARRADIECFARDLEARGRARATITRRLCTIAGFYKYAVEEELLDRSPPPMSAVPAWTTSPMRPAWTATSSARCWSPPGSARRPSTR
jgi:integrase/recombinase XerD